MTRRGQRAKPRDYEQLGEKLVHSVLRQVADAASVTSVAAVQAAARNGHDPAALVDGALEALRTAIHQGTDELIDAAVTANLELLTQQPPAVASGGT